MNIIIEDVIKYIPTTSQDVLTDEAYKANIILQIDTALGTIVQNGVGKHVSVFSNNELTWDEFFVNGLSEAGIGFAKQYVFTQVQLLFDTPASNIVTILEKSAEQSLWRARLESENIKYGE